MLESYSCKQAGSDKKLYKSLDKELETQYSASLETHPTIGSFSSSTLAPPSSSYSESHLSASPFGPLTSSAGRKTMINLIATLNAIFVDYDFRNEGNLSMVTNSVNTTLASILPNYNVEVQEKLWSAIDAEISLQKTEIYSYIPEGDSDPFTEAGIMQQVDESEHHNRQLAAENRVDYFQRPSNELTLVSIGDINAEDVGIYFDKNVNKLKYQPLDDSQSLLSKQGYHHTLESLPVEILFCICKYLDVQSLTAISMTDRFFREMGDDEEIWKGTWDKVKKGKMILSREGRAISHGGDYLGSYQSARGSQRIDSGCTYWEIIIEALNFNQTGFHLVIGVIPESFTVWQSYLTSNGGWGYLADGRKANNSGNGIPYAKGFVQGDRIGVLLDMNERTLSYYLNGVYQGVAFRNIDQPVYPGVSLLTGGQSISFVQDPVFPTRVV
eukprot:gene16675-19817_t